MIKMCSIVSQNEIFLKTVNLPHIYNLSDDYHGVYSFKQYLF